MRNECLARANTETLAPSKNIPKPSIHKLVESKETNTPTLPTAAAESIALRSPIALINLAAGISATSVPTMTSPVMIPAVGRLAPSA